MHIELPSPPAPYPHPPPLDNDNIIGTNQCLCLPKAELNTKNSTKRQLCCRLVEFFGDQLDYSCRLKSVLATAEERVM